MYYACVTIKCYARTTRVFAWISNSTSRLPICNREVEHDPVLKT